MQKSYCDMCGKPATRSETIHYHRTPNPRPVGTDKKAKISTTISFGFVDHSLGFGGPPDLCRECKIGLIEELVVDKFPEWKP